MYSNCLVPLSSSGGSGSGTGGTLITNAGVITFITNPAFWNNNGDYTGTIAHLVEGNYYFDDTQNQKFEFLQGKLRRYTFNTKIG